MNLNSCWPNAAPNARVSRDHTPPESSIGYRRPTGPRSRPTITLVTRAPVAQPRRGGRARHVAESERAEALGGAGRAASTTDRTEGGSLRSALRQGIDTRGTKNGRTERRKDGRGSPLRSSAAGILGVSEGAVMSGPGSCVVRNAGHLGGAGPGRRDPLRLDQQPFRNAAVHELGDGLALLRKSCRRGEVSVLVTDGSTTCRFSSTSQAITSECERARHDRGRRRRPAVLPAQQLERPRPRLHDPGWERDDRRRRVLQCGLSIENCSPEEQRGQRVGRFRGGAYLTAGGTMQNCQLVATRPARSAGAVSSTTAGWSLTAPWSATAPDQRAGFTS